MTIEQLARVGYEANRAYARSLGERIPPGGTAEPVDRDIWTRAARFHLDNPDAHPWDLHGYWLAQEQEAGWSYGPVLDNAAKRHPHHVPWDRLPEPQQRKVTMFAAIVRSLVL